MLRRHVVALELDIKCPGYIRAQDAQRAPGAWEMDMMCPVDRHGCLGCGHDVLRL